eukprot:s205_g24.t4
MEPRGRQEEVVFETPDPPQRAVPSTAPSKVAAEGLDTSATRVQDAFDTFAKKEMSPSSAGVQAGRCHGIPLPQIIYEKKRTARCFPDVEEFLKKEVVSCRRVSVQRTFLHIHQDVGQPPKKKQRQKKEAEDGRVPAWEEYFKSNGFTDCQLVQTFVWRHKDQKDQLIFACVPYPSRPDGALLAEVLQQPAEKIVQCKLKEVQSITKRPLFVCLPFALPKGSLVVADEQLRTESRELLFDCGTVALFMNATEFWRSVKPSANSAGTGGNSSHRPKREFEAMGSSSFEPPEQRLARLQAEVCELLKYTEKSKDTGAADILGADPVAMSTELKVLEQRLAGLAESSWGRSGGRNQASGYAMPSSLVSQLERLASTGPAAPGSDGQVTYEIHYTPSVASISDGAKLASMESSIAEIEKQLGVLQPSNPFPEIEKQLGVLQPSNPFPDLQTAITQLQKRISLLDAQKLETIQKSLDKVLSEVQQVLNKKAELEGTADKDLDLKIFCHRWSATAASLPFIVARLQSLQALHLQSASFASRLNALEKQQEELARLLETTSEAVQDLHTGLRENISIVKDNMKSLEDKIAQAMAS